MPSREEQEERDIASNRVVIFIAALLAIGWCSGLGLLMSGISLKDLTLVGWSSVVFFATIMPSLAMLAPPVRAYVTNFVLDRLCVCCESTEEQPAAVPEEQSGQQA